MYSIDGVPLANPSLGWRFSRTSEPGVSRTLSRPDFNAANRDGTISVRGHVSTPTVTLVARAPGSSVETLRRLMSRGTTLTLTADPSISAGVEALSLGHRTITPAGGGLHEITVVYRIPAVWWRDVATTDWSSTIPASGTAGAANMQVLTATSGAVRDALVVVQGSITNPRISGANGTWMEYTTHLTSCWARFDAARGRLYFGTNSSGSDPFTDGSTDYTNLLATGPYPYFLELQPASTGDPACTLGISWDSVEGPTTVTVRARNAYDR